MSIGASIELQGLPNVHRHLDRIVLHMGSPAGRSALLEREAAIVESQTRRRISEEKTSPEGEAWPKWSTGYAKTRHGGHSLLQSEGHLLDSLTTAIGTSANEAYVGSNLIYAAIQNSGGTDNMAPGPAGIPAREYLGISDENLQDIEDDIEAWAMEVVGL